MCTDSTQLHAHNGLQIHKQHDDRAIWQCMYHNPAFYYPSFKEMSLFGLMFASTSWNQRDSDLFSDSGGLAIALKNVRFDNDILGVTKWLLETL